PSARSPSIYTLSLHDALPISTDRAFYGDLASMEFLPNLSRSVESICNKSTICNCSTREGFNEMTSLINCYLSQYPARYNFLIQSDRKSTRLNSSHVKISYAVF